MKLRLGAVVNGNSRPPASLGETRCCSEGKHGPEIADETRCYSEGKQ